MQKTILLLFIFLSFSSYAQKNISLPDNRISERFYQNLDSAISEYDLEDLRKSNKTVVRIWRQNEIINISENSSYIFHAMKNGERITEKKPITISIDPASLFEKFINQADLFYKNDKRPIDGFPTTVELNKENNYQVISFYRNPKLEKIISEINKEISLPELKKEIVKDLPPGNYTIGMSNIRIDHLNDMEEKSDFFKKIFPEIRQKLNINRETPPTKMPLVIINNEQKFLKDLNDLSEAQVQSYEIIDDKRKSIYGARGYFGVITVTTK